MQNKTLFVAMPSYKGISEEEAKERCAEKALIKEGYSVAVAVLNGSALIDLARAELTAMFMVRTKCEAILYMDDDIEIEAASLLQMLAIMASHPGVGVLSAPCKMRTEGNFYNIIPTSLPDEEKLVDCLWTGLGCVLVSRKIIATLYAKYPRLWFKSQATEGAHSVGLFNSLVVDESDYSGERETGAVGAYLGDDRAFSHRLRQSGILIQAYVDAKTDHRGIKGHMASDMASFEDSLSPQKPGLVGSDGRPL